MNYVIPVLLILLFSYSLIKKEDNYSSFVNGAQKSLTLIFDIFANIVAIFILIELFNFKARDSVSVLLRFSELIWCYTNNTFEYTVKITDIGIATFVGYFFY